MTRLSRENVEQLRAVKPMFMRNSCCSFPTSAHYGLDGLIESSDLEPHHTPEPIADTGVVLIMAETWASIMSHLEETS